MKQYTYQSTKPRQRTLSSGSDFKSLLLFYILPFIVINGFIFFLATTKPKFDVVIGETHDYNNTTMVFTIKSHLPTKNLSITLNATPLELEKKGKTYTADITENGVVEISLENFNGMMASSYEHVNVLDDELPAITKYTIEDGILTVGLSDTQSGIDFSSIHAIDSMGTAIAPLSVDKINSEVTLRMDTGSLTLLVKDMSGNVMEQPFSLNSSNELETEDHVETIAE